MAKITVDPTACVRCGGCVEACFAARVFEMTERGSQAVNPDACWACGQCVAICPADAIDHDLFPLEDCPIVERSDLPSLERLTNAFRFRRSTRTFQPKAVERETIRELVSIGRWAPTASNNQALDWIAFDDRARIAELSKATVDGMIRFARMAGSPVARPFVRLVVGKETATRLRRSGPMLKRMAASLADGADPIFYHAPVLLIGHGQRGNVFGRDDAIYATYNMMLAAEHFELGSCQIGFFQAVVMRSSRLRKLIGLPAGRVPQVAMILGYPQRPFRRLLPRRDPDLIWNPR